MLGILRCKKVTNAVRLFSTSRVISKSPRPSNPSALKQTKPLQTKSPLKKFPMNDTYNLFDTVTQQYPTKEAQDQFIRQLQQYKDLIRCEDDRLAMPYPPGVEFRYWGTDKRPPFFGRHNAILAILRHAFTIETSARPPAVICTAPPGFGKTRLLAEWGIRALQSPAIIHAFLNDKLTIDLHITQPVISQLEQAKLTSQAKVRFLVRLHQTLMQQRVMYGIASIQLAPTGEPSLKYFLLQNLRRFEGLKLQQPDIEISSTALKDKDIPELIKIFDRCVDAKSPPYHPLVQVDGYDTKDYLTLLIIDECHTDSNECTTNSNAHKVFRDFAYYARTLNKKILVTMGGTKLGGLYLANDPAAYNLLYSMPMDPLFSHHYLNEVCQFVLNRQLAHAPNQPTTDNLLSFELSAQLYRRWISCCGVPRTIEYFATGLANAYASVGLEDEQKFLRKADMEKALPNVSSLGALFDIKDVEKLQVEAALCLPKLSVAQIYSSPITYETLEATGALIPYSIPITEQRTTEVPVSLIRNYTMPFFYYPERLKKPLDSFSQFSIPQNLGISFEPVPITLQTVVQSFHTTSRAATNLSFKGDLLEDAAAVTLWLRYKLIAGASEYPAVPLSQLIQLDGTAGLDASWKGVIKLIGKLEPTADNFNSTLDIIKQNHLIVINEAKSNFADVIIPLYKGKVFQKFMLVQCCNVVAGQTKISPSGLHKELKGLIKQFSSDLVVVLSPNIPSARLSTRTAKHKQDVKLELEKWEENGNIAVHNGDDWLSPWFVHTFRQISATKWLL